MGFDQLGLAEPILRAVREQGYTDPTPIQRAAIPAVLAGGDLLAGAQTGTGKTAGFVLPMLQRLAALPATKNKRGRPAVRALILTPTRELAAQVEESVRVYGKHMQLSSYVMFGGVGMQPQIDALRRGIDILVATPGRLLDHHQQGFLDLSHVQVFVLDEADRMLDMGFIHDIRKVLALLPADVATPDGTRIKRQNLLFSATFSDDIKALADRLLNKPQVIEVARRNTAAETVEQKAIAVDRDRKKDLLAHLIRERNWYQVLVFTRMKHGANRLAEFLNKEGITALAIHGNKSQGARTKALSEFKTGDLQVLVATDIAARGIDIDELPHVVNFELPNVPEDYVHRIGRTGRAGSTGEALSLVCVDEEGFLEDIEKLIRKPIPRAVEPGFEPDPHAVPQPIQIGRQTLNGASRRGGGGRAAAPSQHAPRGGTGSHRAPANGGRGGSGGAHRGAPPAGGALRGGATGVAGSAHRGGGTPHHAHRSHDGAGPAQPHRGGNTGGGAHQAQRGQQAGSGLPHRGSGGGHTPQRSALTGGATRRNDASHTAASDGRRPADAGRHRQNRGR